MFTVGLLDIVGESSIPHLMIYYANTNKSLNTDIIIT